MSKDILYKPNLQYKKNYYTEGIFEETKKQEEIKNHIITNKIDSINSLQNTIDNNLKLIPSMIIDSYISPYKVLKEEVKNIKPNYKLPERNNIINNSDDKDDDFPSDPFSKGEDIYIDIKDPYAEKSELIQEQYYIDFLDVYKDYLDKLNVSFQNYIYSSLSTIKIKASINSEKDLEDYNTSAINNKDLYHLSDYIIKSNIALRQNLLLHQKLFDLDSAILHVRGIKIGEKTIERYYNIEKIEETNELAMESNILLEESKRVANKKYKEKFLELYKYLNSNVILMDESLQTLLKENKSAMAINIYEVRENTDDTNSTN